MPPIWLALLARLPEDVTIERMPVASPQLVASGKADAIAGWESIRVYLSDPADGLRHVLITLGADGALLSGGDTVMFHREEQRDGELWNVYEHHSVGGRFETDGSFRGTRWITHTEQRGDDEASTTSKATPSSPSPQDVEQLRALIAWVIERAPAGKP
jgi:hypothetical protein